MDQSSEREREVGIQVGEAHLGGTLTIPEGAPGLVLFVPGATHLLEEPGTLEEVARLATDWFKRYLTT